jgi:steroid 5-alpha reductase family enzyme
MKLSSPSRKSSHKGSSFLRMFLYLTIYTFFVVTIVAIATPRMSNDEAHNAVFGSFDSTGAAILLIGFPWLCLQYLRHHHEYHH